MTSLRTFASAAILLCSACQTAPEARSPSVSAFPAQMEEVAANTGAPGIVAGLYRDGALVELFAWGGAACNGGGAANAEAGYEIGSITKHMTAIALLQLQERGLVRLDDTLGNYVPDLPPAWRQISLRQLLTHTSGIPDYEAIAGYDIYQTSPAPSEIIAIVADRPLDFEPDSNFAYSNTGYYLLSLVIERVSSRSYSAYMEANVFAPLHLENTYVSGSGPPDADIAQGCRPNAEGGERTAVPPITEASTLGAGGVVSTLQEWARWDAALDSDALLPQSAMTELFTPATTASGANTEYALGMFVTEFRGVREYSHTGQTAGFSSSYVHFPEQHAGLMIFANTYGARLGSLATALRLRLLPELSYHRLVAPPDPDPATTALIRRALRQVILGETPMDLLQDDMRAFATDPRFDAARARVGPLVAALQTLEYLRSENSPDGGYVRHLYRARAGEEVLYFTFGWRDGMLYRLRWEDA